jgi:tetratricopeptide (TPR) repeat protein
VTDDHAPRVPEDYHELARFLEQELLTCRTPGESDELRLRLARLYLTSLQDPARSAVHAEQLLQRDEVGAAALQVTTALLDHVPLAPRMAELLSTTYARLGRVDEEAAALAAELDLAQPPRSEQVRRRLAELRYRQLGDPESALGLVEPLVAKDPGDDELRRFYIEMAESLSAQLRAAETLGRAIKRAKANDVRERVGFDIATLYLQEGELRQARNAFLEVVLVDAGGPSAIAASLRLLDLEAGPGDPQVMGTALEMIAKAAPDSAARQDAAARLLSLHESRPLKESRLAVAFQALVDSSRADEALAWLRTFYDRKGDKSGLSGVYRRQALRATDPAVAKSLSLRSIELSFGDSEEERLESWLGFVRDHGPDRRAHAELMVLLEKTLRWDELCRVLEADVELATAEERAALLSRLGQTRLVRLDDPNAALAAFGRCLALDPGNELALGAVESLMATGDHRLDAAEVLEPIYRQARFDLGELRAVETRAELLPDPRLGLAAFAAAVDIAVERLSDLPRGIELAGRALSQALAFVSDAVPGWLVRLEHVAGLAKQPRAHAALLLDLLGDGPVNTFERVAVAVSAVEALRAAESPDEALALCLRVLEKDPSSPELLRRLDELLGEKQAPQQRLARYEAALQGTTAPERRTSLRHTIAGIRRDSLDDLAGAVDVWREILAAEPADFAAYDALIGATAKLGDADGALDLMDCARKSLLGHERNRMTVRKALALVESGAADRALDLCCELIDEPALDPSLLQEIAEIANGEDDAVLYRRALELLSASGEPAAKQRAHERLGDFLFDKLGDRPAAADSWKAAAQMCDDGPAGQELAQRLYARVLEARPNDGQAARQLVEIYARSGNWMKLPAGLRVLFDADEDPGGCVLLLLRLEDSAVSAGALDEFVSLVDELAGRLGRDSPGQTRALGRSRARALGSDPARQAAASQAYRQLIETFESDEDVRDFQSFSESRPGADERHQDRRWIHQWNAAHSARPAEVLIEWAKAEEEYGAPEAAIAIYERLAATDAGRPIGLESLCRLKLHAGDFAGGLAAFRALRESQGDEERIALDLRIARLLLDEVDRPVDAAVLLAPALAVRPPISEARELVRRMLADPVACDEIGRRIEQAADGAGDLDALRIFDFLVAGEVAPGMPAARRRWFQRIVDLSQADPGAALTATIRGATELPDATSLWDGAERIARDLGQPEVVSAAYHQVLVEQAVDSVLAEALGRRMVRFEEECAIESPQSIEALLKVLERAPGAGWALDRVKLVLGAQARYGELFDLFDRAIEAASDARQRQDLLHEAAFAAKDLASLPQRAIAYLESLHALRSDDAAVEGALERLYERQGHKVELIGLLGRRVTEASGFKRRDLRRRIGSLWLDLGDTTQAGAVVEQMLAGDAFVADVVDLLERILEQAPSTPRASEHDRAIELLRRHYESLDRIDDLVRIAERSLALARSADQRAHCIRDLVKLRLVAAARGPAAFAQVIPRMESDVAGDPWLAKIAYRSLLIHAVRALKRASAPADDARRADAEAGAWRVVEGLRALLLAHGHVGAAFALLYRASRLPFDRSRRRELLCSAAVVCSERLQETARAIEIFEELYDDDAGDEVAAKSFERFSQLLDAAGLLSKLASRWEEQAGIRARAGSAAEERSCWERAAHLWERQEAWEQAVRAYLRGAALGSEASFEALARIQAGRREWAEAAKALEWLYAHSPAKIRGSLALRLAEAYSELGRRDRSRACLEAALQEMQDGASAASPESDPPSAGSPTEQVRQRLIALYRQDELWQPLAHLLSAEAHRSSDRELKLALWREAADLHRGKLGEPAEAAALLELAVSLDPHDRAQCSSLVDVLETLQRWDQAVAVLRGQIELYGEHRSKDRAAYHRRLSAALVKANRMQDALAELRLAVEMHPSHPASLYDLARVALDLGELDLSERVYRALLLVAHRPSEDQATPAPPRVDVFLDLSEIALQKGDSPRAMDLVDSAFEEALEHGEDPGRLERGLRARGRHGLLARALERRVGRGATLTDRAIALADLLELWRKELGQSSDLGSRIQQYAERIAHDLDHEEVTDASAWVALCTVCSSFGDDDASAAAAAPGSKPGDGRGERPITLLEAAIPKVKPGADRSRLRVLLAKALLERTRPDAAIAVLSSALAEDPVGREATELLSDLLERQGRLPELVTALDLRFRSLPPAGNVDDFFDAAWRLGRALELAGRAKEALPVYESVLDWQPADREMLGTLAGRMEHLGSERVADCLERWIAVDVGAAPALATRLVELRDSQGDTAGAIRALEAGFSADPGGAALRDRLVQSYEKQAQWADAARVLSRALDAAPDDRALLRRLIEAYGRARGDREAVRVLDGFIARHPADAELLSLRASVRERVGEDEGATSDLEAASVADARYVNALLALLARIAGRSDSPGTDAHTIRLVDTLIRLNRPKQARRELERLLARSPNHVDGLGRIASLAAAEGNWEAAAGAFRKLLLVVQRGGNREELVRVAVATADACGRTGGLGEVREELERVLDVLSRSPELAPEHERLCRAMKDWGRLANLLVERAERQQNVEDKTALLLRAGQLLLEERRDPASALVVIERCLATTPQSIEASLLWSKAQVTLGRAEHALPVLYDTAERSRGMHSPLVADVYLEIGRAHLALDELVEAFDALEFGFGVDWRTGDIAMLLGLVALDLDEEKTAERAFSAVTTLPPRKEASGPGADAATKAVAFYHLASIALTRGDLAKARRLANKAVGGDPGHGAARALLEKLNSQTISAAAPAK